MSLNNFRIALVGIMLTFTSIQTAKSQDLRAIADSVMAVVSSDWDEWGITTGMSAGRYVFGELGFYKSHVIELGGFPIGSVTANLSSEFWFDNDFVLGPKAQLRMHVYTFDFGLSAIHYISESKYSTRLRPEAGFGTHRFGVNYGYNFKIIDGDLDRVSRHVLVLRYYLRLKRKFTGEYDRFGNRVGD